MQRRAIIVADAAGSAADVAATLARLGFTMPAQVAQLTQALGELRNEPFDLLIVPLGGIEPAQLASLEQAIRAHPSLAVVGTAPSADPDLILRALRAGVHEFLVAPPPQQDLLQAVERLMRRSNVADGRGEIIAVYSGKGGLGSTSIAVNIGAVLATQRAPAPVALVDCMLGGGDVRVFLNLRPVYDMGDVLARLHDLDAELLTSLMTKEPRGSFVLPAAEDPLFDDAFDGASLTTILQMTRTAFDTTVLDCEHHLSERTLAALDAADRVLVVTQPSVPALSSTRRTLELFERLGYPAEKVCVVLNRFQYGDVFTLANVSEALKREVYWTLPNDYRTASAALNMGVSVVQQDPQSKLARSLADLATKLRGAGGHKHNGKGDARGDAGHASRLRNLFGKSRGSGHVT
jgi:pilus assembly protein CpaE